MEGVRDNPGLQGIIPHAFQHVFEYINKHASSSTRCLVRISYLEIYNEDIYDLLSKDGRKLELKERPDTGVYVKDLSTFVVKSVDEMEKLMSIGNKSRSVGSTNMNARSSRSHSIFTITVEMSQISNVDNQEHIRAGKLHLVDLAGSERQSKTGATGERFKEATKINLSLSALGNVISALVDGKSTHIPYRDSKLTRLLQDSLGGNAKTLMIATLSPAHQNYEETLSTLRYANRAKNIKNKPKINEDPKDALLREFQDEINRLRAALENGTEEEGDVEVSGTPSAKMKRRKSFSKEDDLVSMQAAVESERKAIMEMTGMIEEERKKMLDELDTREAEINSEKERRELALKRLQEMEAKLLVGGVSIIEKTEEQAKELEMKAAELEQKRKREEELQKELDAKLEAQLQIEEEFSTLQEEAAVKTKKIKQLTAISSSMKKQLSEVEQEIQMTREDLLETIRDLSKELKLKTMIVHSFIPEEELEHLEEISEYDPISEKWIIPHIAHAGNNLQGRKRHIRDDAKSNDNEKSLSNNDLISKSKSISNTSLNDWMGFSAHPIWQTGNVFLSYMDICPDDYDSLTNETSYQISSSPTKADKSNPRRQPNSSASRKGKSSKESITKLVRADVPKARGLVGQVKRYA